MITTNQNNQYKSTINFGTMLKLEPKLSSKISETSYLGRKINEFKKFLAKDGKTWVAELSEDLFSKQTEITDVHIKKVLNTEDGFESRLAIMDLLPKMKNINERNKIIENYINKSLT